MYHGKKYVDLPCFAGGVVYSNNLKVIFNSTFNIFNLATQQFRMVVELPTNIGYY